MDNEISSKNNLKHLKTSVDRINNRSSYGKKLPFNQNPKTPQFNNVENISSNEKPPYEIIRKIGNGAFGVIYKARNTQTKENAAIKVLKFCNKNELSEIMMERDSLLSCENAPYCIKYISTYFIQNKNLLGMNDLWLVMEYCSSGSFMHVMDVLQRPLSEQEIKVVCRHISEAFNFLHKFMVHRDVKAANILLNSKGEAKLGDFGEVSLLENIESEKSSSPSPNGSTSNVHGLKGTPYFLSPEVLENNITTKSDVWALGITCIELAEGQPPYADKAPMNYLFILVTDLMTSPPGLSKPENYSPEFVDFISKCLTVSVEDRSSASDLLNHSFIKDVDQNDETLLTLHSLVKNKKEKKRGSIITTTKMETLIDPQTGKTSDQWFEDFLLFKESKKEIFNNLFESKKKRDRTNTSESQSRNKKIKIEIEKKKLLMHVLISMTNITFGVLKMTREINETSYKDCIIGGECIDWLSAHLEIERIDALTILKGLLLEEFLIIVDLKRVGHFDSSKCVLKENGNKLTNFTSKYQRVIKKLGDMQERKLSTPKSEKKSKMEELKSSIQVIQQNKGKYFSYLISDRDWKVLESIGNILTFSKGEYIVKPNETNKCIYRLLSGSVKISYLWKKEECEEFTFSPLLGDTFNDLCVLSHVETTYEDVFVSQNETKISVFPIPSIDSLFKKNTGLKFRFFHDLAIQFAKKISMMMRANQGKTTFNKKEENKDKQDRIITALKSWVSSEDDGFSKKDTELVEVFGLPNDELVLNEFKCTYGKFNKQKGTLILSKNFLCFSSSKTKLKLPLSEITVLKPKIKSLKIKLSTHILPFSFFNISDVENVHQIIFDQMKISIHNSINKLSKSNDSQINQILKVNSVKNINKLRKMVKNMSSDYWEILKTIATPRIFKANQIITKLETSVTRLCQLSRGTCELRFSNADLSFQLKEGDIWGEVAFLTETTPNYEVFSIEEVEIYTYDPSLMHVLFMRNPNLGANFYYHLIYIMNEKNISFFGEGKEF